MIGSGARAASAVGEAAPRTQRALWWWALAAAVALTSAAWWLASPGVEYLVPCAVATALGALPALRLAREARWWALGCLTALAILAAAVGRAELSIVAATRRGEDRAVLERQAVAELARATVVGVQSARAAARAALDAPVDRERAFAALAPLARAGDGERGVVLYRDGRAFAWAGRARVSTDLASDSVGVVASPFYLVAYAAATRGPLRAVATVLVDALPPGDRLADPLTRHVAERVGIRGFTTATPVGAPPPGTTRVVAFGAPIADAAAALDPPGQELLRVTERSRARIALVLALALVCFLVTMWRGTRAIGARLAVLAVAAGCVAVAPLSAFSNYSRLFDPTLYFSSFGGPLTASAGALGVTSALALLGVLAVLRRHGRGQRSWWPALSVVLVAGLGPFLLRNLARGIQTPSYGVNAALWLIWEVPMFLAAAAVLLAGAAAGAMLLGRRRGLPPWVAPAAALGLAVAAPIVWEASGRWPWWYAPLWIVAVAALALSRQTRFVILGASTVAALGATTLVWGRTTRARVDLAEQDLASLGRPDPYAASLVRRLGAQLRAGPTPASRAALLGHFVQSELAAAGYPTALVAWPAPPGGAPAAAPPEPLVLRSAQFAIPAPEVTRVAMQARASGQPLSATLAADPAVAQMLAVPGSDGGVTAIVVAPRTRLIPGDPFARLLGLNLDPEAEPPYTIQLAATSAATAPRAERWRRDEHELHGDWVVPAGRGPARAHVEVELRPVSALVERGALIVLLDLAFVGALWVLSVLADGGVGRWLQARRRTWGRSYRMRITLALLTFFMVPALAFAVWSSRQLAAYAVQSRELLARETLRAVAPADSGTAWVDRESARLDTPLLLYERGELTVASDPLYVSLAPFGRFVRGDVEVALAERDEVTASQSERIAGATALLGYRAVDAAGGGEPLVIAAPARADELALGRRRRDLSTLVLFATAIGAVAALWLSGIAARQLARPIGSLRRAALALASGERLPSLDVDPTVEFQPVFSAFRSMAADLDASRSALEEAQRRTAAVLRNVASGVAAVGSDGRVALANPQAEELLGAGLPAGARFAAAAPAAIADRVLAFLRGASEEEEFELELDGRQLRGRLTRLAGGGVVVVTLDDVTQLARAQRVLAWGEMARQVAHEIKNPLTPIRLGVQHLRRARADARVDFDKVLEQNVTRILTEIDRLDEIARAFSRYGSAPQERAPAEPTDVAAVVRDVVSLETMGASGEMEWRVEGADAPVRAMARSEELREVLLNVFENARLAQARAVEARVALRGSDGTARVEIAVRDDGQGIAPEVLSRVFEPHFSTRTSGSGLGLAISRRLIDSWGGEIGIESEAGEGTVVRITLRAVE